MSKFVPGQWVECVSADSDWAIKVGEFHRVDKVATSSGAPDIVRLKGGAFWYMHNRFRPVEWQVGRTYKTTLEGVTATIKERDAESLYGTVRWSDGACRWDNNGTGRYCGVPIYKEDAPHLTPHLAEQPPAVDTTEPSKPDHINPPHYQQHPSGVEAITITEHFGFNVGNAIKYLWRAGLKGDALQDLRKARWYVEREIQRVEKMKGCAE